jgi:FKBP-type peptidyl-prolyl cis-trans isomerase
MIEASEPRIGLLAFMPYRANPMTNTSRLASAITVSALVLSALFANPAVAAKPKPTVPPKPVLTCKVKTPEGLSYTVIKAGKGEKPTDTSRVTVNYRGLLTSDGTQFDAGDGIKFKVTGVIPGFTQGLKLMQPGGKYRLCIPAALGYGEAGNGPVPANADLVFEVDLLSFEAIPPKPIIAADARACDQKTASGLSYAIIRQGAGRSPTAKDMALVDLVTFDPGSGEIFVRQEWEKIPVERAAPLFAEALGLMQPGASFRLCFPASEASETGPPVPALNVNVDLIDVRPAREPEE